MSLFRKKHEKLVNINEITWSNLSKANKDRQVFWIGSGASADLAFIGLEIGEEAGEVQSALKKLIRAQKGIAGNKISKTEVTRNLEHEIGDLVINISRLSNELGIDVNSCIRTAFNTKSNELGINIKL